MKQSTLFAFVLSVVFAAVGSGTAQTLTLDEAIARTFASNPTLQAAYWAETAAEQERKAAIGLRAPEVGFSGAYLHLDRTVGIDLNNLKQPLGALLPNEALPTFGTLLEPLMQADWELPIQRRNFGFVGGYATLPIWMGGRINAANRAARLRADQRRTQTHAVRQTLLTQLVERYYGLALALQVVTVREAAVEGVRQHLRDALALESNGVIAHSERLYVEVKLSEAQRALEQARLEVVTLRRALETTLGEPTAQLQPVTALFVVDRIEPVSHFRALAEMANPTLQSLTLDQQLADEMLRLRRSDFLPEVVAGGGGVLFQQHLSGLVPRGVVGIGIRIKLFNGLNREYSYAAARATARQVGQLRTTAHDEITLLVDMRYNALLDSRNRFLSLDASLRFAENYLHTQQIAFREGVGRSTELIDAELELASIRVERLDAAYRFDCALAQLLETAGISDRFTTYLYDATGRSVHLEINPTNDAPRIDHTNTTE